MTDSADNTNTKTQMDWFDLSGAGVFITPELVCGKPCILLLDMATNNPLSRNLEEHGFQPIDFEFHKMPRAHLYILFAETISSDLFYKQLLYPRNLIRRYKAALLDIQSAFYEQAKLLFGFRVDTVIKSSVFLGVNHQNNEVYTSLFGRYRVASLGMEDESSYLLEDTSERNLAYLRANTAEDVLLCCEGYIKDAIKKRRNISMQDAVHFANILFEDANAKEKSAAKPYHLLMVLKVFNILYIRHILPVERSVIKDANFFKNRDHYKDICLNSEACPSQPRGVYTDEFASQFSVPPPISFIMQKLLVDGDGYTKEDCEVIDPMFGYGSLTNFLHVKGYNVLGLDKNFRKVNLIKSQQYENTRIVCADGVNSHYLDHKLDNVPFRYVISSPACLKNNKRYRYKDDHGSIVLERMDLIVAVKSLMYRADHGRSVLLLPYFTDPEISFSKTQNADLEKVLTFIASRYKIEGLAKLSSEIYSKSLSKIAPIVVIVGAKRSNYELNKVSVATTGFKKDLIPEIQDYESLWDWCSMVCYRRSGQYEDDRNTYQETRRLMERPVSQDVLKAELEWSGDLLTDAAAAVSEAVTSVDSGIKASEDLFGSSPAEDVSVLSGTPNLEQAEDLDEIDLIMADEPVTASVQDQIEEDASTAQSNETEQVDEPNTESSTETNTETENQETVREPEDGTNESTATGDSVESAPDHDASDVSDASSDGDAVTPESIGPSEPEQLSENDNAGSADKLLLVKGENKDKITRSKGNLFALNAQNQIIRYHSTATLSEPTSNVHQSEFAAYLSGKKNLSEQLETAFDRLGPYGTKADELLAYLKRHSLAPCVEAFVGGHLGLGSPREMNQFFKSEHYDLIAASILKFLNQKSLLVLDSIGMNTDMVFASLMHFHRLNGRGSVFVAKDEAAISRLIKNYRKMAAGLTRKEVPEFIVVHESDDPVAEICRFNKDTVLILLNDPKFIMQLRGRLKAAAKKITAIFGNPGNFGLFFDFDMSGIRYSSTFISHLLKAPTLFRSDTFINHETNLGVISGLFNKNTYARYFMPKLGELDEMTCHLLKINLIEELTLFQRFEDLSNIRASVADVRSVWGGKYEILARTFSATINNIVLLAEDIQKYVQYKDERVSAIRSIAMKLFELSSFCISSVPLTYSIFAAVKNHTKPIVVVPKNIEHILFDLLADLHVPLIENSLPHDLPDFASLNALIENIRHKIRQKKKQGQDCAKELLELNTLCRMRVESTLEYFTRLKNGNLSKYPDITGLIAAFYKSCLSGMNQEAEQQEDIKARCTSLELEISALADLPLCIIDFMRYELEQYQIKCGEISSRSYALAYNQEARSWEPSATIPMLAKYDESHSKEAIAASFNSGEFDVLFVEADEIYGLDLSASRQEQTAYDCLRKRVLMLTYFNKPIQHYLSLIHCVNRSGQNVSPDLHFEVPESPVQNMMFKLVAQQLGLFNIQTDFPKDEYFDLSYYLTASGRKLLVEYLMLNPSYQAHYPNLPVKMWDIYHVLNIANLVDANLQTNIIQHLSYLSKQNLEYLRSEKANPFDMFIVSNKTTINNYALDSGVGTLNKRLSDADGAFNKKIRHATLSYVKDSSKSFTLDLCRAIHKSRARLEEARLKTIVADQFQDTSLQEAQNIKHSECLSRYISHYTAYMISVYRDKIINLLQDRYRKWIFVSPKNIHQSSYIHSHFMSEYGLRVSSTLDDLYFEILMLGDTDLINTFEQSCQILTFLKAYHLTVLNQEKSGVMSPILLPIPSPFNDKTQQISEGLMMGINFPTSLMISLSPKAFSVTMCYPSKSKPIDLNLAYVLEQPDVLKNQSVLSNISQGNADFILKAYRKSKFKDLLGKKIKELNFAKITELTDLEKLSASRHHKTIRAFSHTGHDKKIRSMNVLYGNLFEIYYLLKNQLSLTMISFTDEDGLTQYGFVPPSDTEFGVVVENLVRVSNIGNIQYFYTHFKQRNNRFRDLRSIKWIGDGGKLDASSFGRDMIELSFIGREYELQKIFLDKDVFKEYPVIEQYDENNNPVEVIELPEELQSYNFTPLDLLSAKVHHAGRESVYTFKITHQQFKELVVLIAKKSLYNVALVDCPSWNERNQLIKKINKDR